MGLQYKRERVNMTLLMLDDPMTHKILQSDKNPKPKQTLEHLNQEKKKKKKEPESEKFLSESQKKGRDTEQISPSNKHWSSTSFSEQGETEEGKRGKHRNRPVNTEKN